jgi:hypothetical protein
MNDITVKAMPMNLHEYNDQKNIEYDKNTPDEEGYLSINQADEEAWFCKETFEFFFKDLSG